MKQIIGILTSFILLSHISKAQEHTEHNDSLLVYHITDSIIFTTSSAVNVTAFNVDSLITLGKTYLGLPYRSSSRSPWPLDCSGYVSMLYGQFGISLPRSSGSIAQVSKTIPLKDVQPGDLLFFKGRDASKNRVGHVALVIEVRDNYILMMHSTNSKGIIIEEYPDKYYYTKRFVKAGRVI